MTEYPTILPVWLYGCVSDYELTDCELKPPCGHFAGKCNYAASWKDWTRLIIKKIEIMSSLISTQLKRIKLLYNAAVIGTTDNFTECVIILLRMVRYSYRV